MSSIVCCLLGGILLRLYLSMCIHYMILHCHRYFYKVTLLVIWPKDTTLNIMLDADFAAGVRTAESLVDTELKNNSSNNSSTGGSDSGSRAVSQVVNHYCSTVRPAATGRAATYYNYHQVVVHPMARLQQVLALSCRLGGATGALCAQRALGTLVAAGGITTEACAAAVATTVGSLGWAAVGEAVLAVVRSTQLANLESAAALALKLCSLSPDKRCSGTAAAAAATAATTEQQHVKLELAAVKQEQVAAGDAAAAVAPATTVKSELTAVVKSEPAVKAELTATAAPVATLHTATAAVATVQDGAELVGRYVAALGLGLPIVDATAAASGSSTTAAAADDDDVAVVGVASRHSLRTLTLPQAQALVNMLVTLAAPSGGAAGSGAVRCEEELVS
jgi:hypothetical protein